MTRSCELALAAILAWGAALPSACAADPSDKLAGMAAKITEGWRQHKAIDSATRSYAVNWEKRVLGENHKGSNRVSVLNSWLLVEHRNLARPNQSSVAAWNDAYAFVLQSDRPDSWVISTMDPVKDGEVNKVKDGLFRNWNLNEFFPNSSFFLDPAIDYLDLNELQLMRIRQEDGNLLTVEYCLRSKMRDQRLTAPLTYFGEMQLDASNAYAVVSATLEPEKPIPDFWKGRWEMVRKYKQHGDQALCDEIIITHSSGNQREHFRFSDYSFEPPDKEAFYMRHYGLPEPLTTAPAPRGWFYKIVLGVGLFLLAFGLVCRLYFKKTASAL